MIRRLPAPVAPPPSPRRVCNCSVCTMKGNVHFMVPKARLTMLTGADKLSVYTFGTHTAKVRRPRVPQPCGSFVHITTTGFCGM